MKVSIMRIKKVAGFSAAALSLSALLGCNTLLDVERPDIIDPGQLTGAPEAVASAYYAGAVGDLAYAQGTFSGLMLIQSLFSDEFRFGGTPPEVREHDVGDIRIQNSFAQTPYLNIHRARRATATAADKIKAVLPQDSRVGEMYALSALSTIWIGETYCSNAPFSENDGSDIDYGTGQTTTQIFDRALTLLNSAATGTGGNASVVSLVAVLRGRTLLNKGDFAGAATAVAAVPTPFVYQAYYSSADNRTKNNMRAFIYDFDYLSVSDREGTNGLNYASANDPRVPAELIPASLSPGGTSRFDGRTPMYRLPTYQSFDSPIINASGIEARLIGAEAALRAGDATTWLNTLNTLRTTVPNLDPLADPGSATSRVDLMFRERAFWLFATAHRLGDMRRLVRQYSRPANTVFPTGAYHKDGLLRGGQVSILVPTSEQNNPNYDPDACDPNVA